MEKGGPVMDPGAIDAIAGVLTKVSDRFIQCWTEKFSLILQPVWDALQKDGGADFRSTGEHMLSHQSLPWGGVYRRTFRYYESATMHVGVISRSFGELSNDKYEVQLKAGGSFVIVFLNGQLWEIQGRDRTVVGNFRENEHYAVKLRHAVRSVDHEGKEAAQ